MYSKYQITLWDDEWRDVIQNYHNAVSANDLSAAFGLDAQNSGSWNKSVQNVSFIIIIIIDTVHIELQI